MCSRTATSRTTRRTKFATRTDERKTTRQDTIERLRRVRGPVNFADISTRPPPNYIDVDSVREDEPAPMDAEVEQPPPDPAPADAVGPVAEPPMVAPPTRPSPEAPAASSTPPVPAEDPTTNPVATASSSSSTDEERQRRRRAAIESYNLGRRLDGLPPKRARMAENVPMDELPTIPDGDEENLYAILDDDFDEVSEYIYLLGQ